MHIQRLLVTLVGVVEDVGLHQIFFYAAVLDLKERRAGTQDPPLKFKQLSFRAVRQSVHQCIHLRLFAIYKNKSLTFLL